MIHADWIKVDKSKTYPFIWAENPLEINLVNTVTGFHPVQIEFLDKDGNVVDTVFVVLANYGQGPTPSQWMVANCMMYMTMPTSPEGTLEQMPNNILTISRVQDGAVIEFNGVVVADFDVTEHGKDQAACDGFLQGDVQSLHFHAHDALSKSFRQSGEWLRLLVFNNIMV